MIESEVGMILPVKGGTHLAQAVTLEVSRDGQIVSRTLGLYGTHYGETKLDRNPTIKVLEGILAKLRSVTPES